MFLLSSSWTETNPERGHPSSTTDQKGPAHEPHLSADEQAALWQYEHHTAGVPDRFGGLLDGAEHTVAELTSLAALLPTWWDCVDRLHDTASVPHPTPPFVIRREVATAVWFRARQLVLIAFAELRGLTVPCPDGPGGGDVCTSARFVGNYGFHTAERDPFPATTTEEII